MKIGKLNFNVNSKQSLLIATWITALSTLALFGGVLVAGYQIKINSDQIEVSQQTSLAALMIEINKQLLNQEEYKRVHHQLGEGNEWYQSNGGPVGDEWEDALRYSSLFEQIELWRRSGIITLDNIDNLYSHRVARIYNNSIIHNHILVENASQWKLFNSLVEALQTLPESSTFQRKTAGFPFAPQVEDEG